MTGGVLKFSVETAVPPAVKGENREGSGFVSRRVSWASSKKLREREVSVVPSSVM